MVKATTEYGIGVTIINSCFPLRGNVILWFGYQFNYLEKLNYLWNLWHWSVSWFVCAGWRSCPWTQKGCKVWRGRVASPLPSYFWVGGRKGRCLLDKSVVACWLCDTWPPDEGFFPWTIYGNDEMYIYPNPFASSGKKEAGRFVNPSQPRK